MKKWEEEQRKKAHTRKVQEAKSTLSGRPTATTKPDLTSKSKSPWVSNRTAALGDSY